MKLKGEMSMLNVLQLQESDVDAVCAELQQKRDEAPQFFMQSPIIVDCFELGDEVLSVDFLSLKQCLQKLGFIPVGVRNVPASMAESLAQNGWALMRSTARAVTENAKTESTEQLEPSAEEVKSEPITAPAAISSVTVTRPVRSGQQVYAAGADMTVLAPTSAGSEVMADGSIHVYGPIRGRVLAGALGNETARIFCQSLQAELIAIAGRYQLLDESDTELKGKPAMIRLDGEKLIIEALA